MANSSTEAIVVASEADVSGTQAQHEPNIIAPEVQMLILTWVTFFLLLAILYKFAWKPILSALDAREAKIRKALDDARQAEEKLTEINQARASRIAEADNQARDIVERSRKAAVEAAKNTEHKAREKAQILLTNAQQELRAQVDKARVSLREESVAAAVGLAEKILQEELDDKKHQKLIDRLIEDFYPDEYKE